MNRNIVKAVNVPNNTWMFVLSTKQWIKKLKNGKNFVEAAVFGDKKIHYIDPTEDVELQKGT